MIAEKYRTGEPTDFCDTPQEIENYWKALRDKSNMWVCHHRDETDLGVTSKWLIERGEYYHLPPERLIFLTESEHTAIHARLNAHRKTRQSCDLDIQIDKDEFDWILSHQPHGHRGAIKLWSRIHAIHRRIVRCSQTSLERVVLTELLIDTLERYRAVCESNRVVFLGKHGIVRIGEIHKLKDEEGRLYE